MIVVLFDYAAITGFLCLVLALAWAYSWLRDRMQDRDLCARLGVIVECEQLWRLDARDPDRQP